MPDFLNNYRKLTSLKVVRCFPPMPYTADYLAQAAFASYLSMFRGGNPRFHIPGYRKILRMSARQRKENYVDGIHNQLSLELKIRFSRQLTDADGQADYFTVEDEHSRAFGNWFLPLVEEHNLWTLLSVPLINPKEPTQYLYADEPTVWDQILKFLMLLCKVELEDFVEYWSARFISENHVCLEIQSSYCFFNVNRTIFRATFHHQDES